MNFEEWLNKSPVAFGLPDYEISNLRTTWNAAIDEVIKIAEDGSPETYIGDIAEEIKELKE